MNPQSPAGVVLLGLGAWLAVLVPLFLWRLLRGEAAPQAPAEDAGDPDDGDEGCEPVPLVAEFTETVPFDTAVLIGPARDREDA